MKEEYVQEMTIGIVKGWKYRRQGIRGKEDAGMEGWEIRNRTKNRRMKNRRLKEECGKVMSKGE